MDTLSPQSLDWALSHISKFGDTDIFPLLFEVEGIKHAWNWLQPKLASIDLQLYKIGAFRRFLVPKPGGAFRVAIQLDPIDSLIYTALIYQAAETIENSRVAVDQRIACSYRVSLDTSGSFFRADNGWPDFQQNATELIKTNRFSHVLLTDISDFYNQIYHHRLDNSLANAGISDERRKTIISFISQLTATQSRGIPVGPLASILLAEACLSDVDNYLLRKGYPHVRYVDDFRIFCRSRREAIKILHDLSDYLNTSQRLSLEQSKTKILTVQNFSDCELVDPEQQEREKQDVAISSLTKSIKTGLARYLDIVGEIDVSLDDEEKNKLTRDNLNDMMIACLEQRPLHLGLTRYILRRATHLRTNVLLPIIFDNLEVLIPALRDVVRYIKVALKTSDAASYGTKLEQFLESSDCADIPFVKLWCIEMILNKPSMLSNAVALRIAEQGLADLGIRSSALVAHTYQQADWVRSYKETWRNAGAWDRRAIIWAGQCLPTDERRHWLGQLQDTTTYDLEKAVAQRAAMV